MYIVHNTNGWGIILNCNVPNVELIFFMIICHSIYNFTLYTRVVLRRKV